MYKRQPGVRTPFIIRWPHAVRPGSTSKQVVSSIDIAPTILKLAGLEPLDSFQGRSIARILSGARMMTRQYAFAEHNWHDYRAFERAVHGVQYCYVRNWLPNTPSTPPADAVRSVTFTEMKRLKETNSLSAAQARCFNTPRNEEFLFDVESDPDCLNNLVEDPTLEATLTEMRMALRVWQEKTNDSFPGEEKITPDGFDRDTGNKQIRKAHPSFDAVETKKRESNVR